MTVTLTRVRRLSGVKPTGRLQLGNLLGAIRPMVADQDRSESVVMIADLHGLTVEHDPMKIRERTLEQATTLLAAGVDPDRTILYVQSHLAEHAQLHYLLECATGYGEAQRMIQFKEKSGSSGHVRLSLLTYPVLMAADILLHDVDEVPVGDDQTQHLELTRDVAFRFNARYGRTFTVPRAVTPTHAARVMDLADPLTKMGKSSSADAGIIGLLDPPELVRRKVMRAVTDTFNAIGPDRDRQPGITNLLDILAACGGSTSGHASYGELKATVADAIIETLRPLQTRYQELSHDPAEVLRVLRSGAERARPRAAATLRRATEAIGLFSA